MPTRSQQRTAARAFDDAQAVALTDDRLHVFAHCTCGVDGLLFWIDREDDLTRYWVEWWTTQPGVRLPWRQRLQAAWRLLTRGVASTHELLLSVVAAEQLASWLLYEGSAAARPPHLNRSGSSDAARRELGRCRSALRHRYAH